MPRFLPLAGLGIEKVFCSDLGRAKRTWELLSNQLADVTNVEYSKEIREIDFGQLAGELKAELMPTILKHKADQSMKYPEGESGAMFIKRVVDYMEKCITENINRTLLFVTPLRVC